MVSKLERNCSIELRTEENIQPKEWKVMKMITTGGSNKLAN
ncbi:MAG: hypothetical protein ACTS6G_00450 [Candidatus Hodgkinia cicadicola]